MEFCFLLDLMNTTTRHLRLSVYLQTFVTWASRQRISLLTVVLMPLCCRCFPHPHHCLLLLCHRLVEMARVLQAVLAFRQVLVVLP